MNVKLTRHWTSLLGVVLILSAFITLFKYSMDEGWITDAMKIGFGLLGGIALCTGGIGLAVRKKQAASGEITIGLGASLLYATFSFAGIYYEIWSSSTVLFGMIAVTAGVSAYAYRFDSRLLMNISLAGGLISPLLMQPATDQVFALFLYLLVMNSAFLFLSILKGWSELRAVSFVGSWVLYAVYFFHFEPGMDGLWAMPFRYALAAFVFYLFGLMVASWKNNRCFDGWNLYLLLANGVLFGFWAILILEGDLHFSYILGFIGVVYAGVGVMTYRWTGSVGIPTAAPFLGGVLMLLLGLANTGSEWAMKPMLNVFLWSAISVLLIVLSRKRRMPRMHLAAALIWFFVGIYWYIVTWDTPRGEWFGLYLPFLNTGAAAWIVLCVIGFYFSRTPFDPKMKKNEAELLSNVFALLSHLIVGGLLTLQIENGFREYAGNADETVLSLLLSVVWGVYALLLFLWGAYCRQALFRWFGSAVLVFVAFKAIFLDLGGEQVLYKVIVLLALGGISFLATWINRKWSEEKGAAVQK